MAFGITTYRVAVGHNNAAGLSTLSPQPRNASDIAYPEFLDGLDESVTPQGKPFVELTFNALSYSEYAIVLAKFGLSATIFNADVTVRLRTDIDAYSNYNGVAKHRTGKERGYGFWRNFTITVAALTVI